MDVRFTYHPGLANVVLNAAIFVNAVYTFTLHFVQIKGVNDTGNCLSVL